MDAPTPSEIIACRASFGIFCKRCRAVRDPPRLAERLVAAGKGDTPVNHLVFKCHRCGDLGEPHVTGQGNMTIGRPRLWPPS